MSIKFLVWGGGVFWVWGGRGGGSADFVSMGAGIFLRKFQARLFFFSLWTLTPN